MSANDVGRNAGPSNAFPMVSCKERNNAMLDIITLVCGTSGELKVDRDVLCLHSRFFQDMLSSCDSNGVIKIDESLLDMSQFMEVAKGTPPACMFDTKSSACWDFMKTVIDIADKYDSQLVKERLEKWLVSRCLKGRVRCHDFKFQDISLGLDWLLLCQKYGLRDLGWFIAYDLGTQLAETGWPETSSSSSLLKDVSDAEFLKVMLLAVQDSVLAKGTAAADGSQGGDVDGDD